MQMDALSQLSPRQLAALSATPGLLTSPAQVNLVMNLIPNQLLPAFFDDFSSAIVVSVHHTDKPRFSGNNWPVVGIKKWCLSWQNSIKAMFKCLSKVEKP